MKTKTCPDCKFKITDPSEWSFVFKECMVCNEIRFENVDFSNDEAPDRLPIFEKPKATVGAFKIGGK